MTMERERFLHIDMLKACGIILMVLCHTGLRNSFTQWTYSFHMPLFFIASGMLLGKSKGKFVDCVKKRASQLLVPYFLFALILCFGSKGYLDWPYIMYGSRNALSESFSFTPLWFLPCFFLSTIIVHVIWNGVKENATSFCLVCCAVGILGFILGSIVPSLGFPFSFDVAMVGVLLIAIGRTFKCNIMGGVFLMLLGSILSFLNLPESLTTGNPHVEMSISHYGNEVLFLFNACSIVIGMTSVFTYLSHGKLIRLIAPVVTWIGKYSLAILCLHGLFIKPINRIISSLPINIEWLTNLLTTILVLIICYPIICFVKKYTPNLIGNY